MPNPVPVEMREGGMDDWYVIERGMRRLHGADVEGTREDMLNIATAIKGRTRYHATRCAVDATDADKPPHVVDLWSPRNSVGTAKITREEADHLAIQIGEFFDRATALEMPRSDKLRDIGIKVVSTAQGEPAAFQVKEPPLIAQVCTRPKHDESPCNGYPRKDCPGYEAWASEQRRYIERELTVQRERAKLEQRGMVRPEEDECSKGAPQSALRQPPPRTMIDGVLFTDWASMSLDAMRARLEPMLAALGYGREIHIGPGPGCEVKMTCRLNLGPSGYRTGERGEAVFTVGDCMDGYRVQSTDGTIIMNEAGKCRACGGAGHWEFNARAEARVSKVEHLAHTVGRAYITAYGPTTAEALVFLAMQVEDQVRKQAERLEQQARELRGILGAPR